MLKSHLKTVRDILQRGPIHPFPARMAPGIALEALGESKRQLRILDPMVGSGTVVAVARKKGHKAFGVDLDPLAVLLAGVWTRTVDPVEATDKAAEVLSRAKSKMQVLPVGQAYPHESDDETRAFIRYWFDDYARRQLSALSFAINGVRNRALRDVLWCGFSRLIITKQAGASRAMDLSHSRPHREFERALVKPFKGFAAAVNIIVSNCPQRSREDVGPVASVRLGDARMVPGILDGSIDLVLTSPPYLNAIDYMRCSKFSLVWMGHKLGDLRNIRASSVGTETSLQQALDSEWVKALIKQLRLKPMLSTRNYALLATYVWDMHLAISEVSRVLRRRGRAVYVIGESTCRGTYIRNSRVVTEIADRCGLRLVSRHSRTLPANRRYLPPPSGSGSDAGLDCRMRREVVVQFRKP